MAAELHELLVTNYDIVEIVQDGATLVEAARRQRPDAIVCDIGMPGVNGLDAAVSILATRADARIVFVTVQDNRAVIRKALTCGARGTSSSVTPATSWSPPCLRRSKGANTFRRMPASLSKDETLECQR